MPVRELHQFAGDPGVVAGFEPQLLPLIQDRPKAMLEVKGRTILERQVSALRHCGVRDVTVVRGYRKEHVVLPSGASGVRFADNDRFAETGELHSLLCGGRALEGPFLCLYGDIIFEPAILVRLLQTRADVAVVVDRAFHDTYRAGLAPTGTVLDLVVTATPPNGRRFLPSEGGSRVLRIGPEVPPMRWPFASSIMTRSFMRCARRAGTAMPATCSMRWSRRGWKRSVHDRWTASGRTSTTWRKRASGLMRSHGLGPRKKCRWPRQ